jgi:Tol biopolymer transport system component
MRYIKFAIALVVVIGLAVAGFAQAVPGHQAKAVPKRAGYIAYWSLENDGLWICQLDGKGKRRLAKGTSWATIAFSRPRGLLAWWSDDPNKDSVGSRLWVCPVAGGKAKNIFTDRPGKYHDEIPAFIPDGQGIVFARGNLGIWQIDANGRHLHRLMKDFPKGGDCSNAAVSPDGKLIAFSWERRTQRELCLWSDADQKLLQTGILVNELAWTSKGMLALIQHQGDIRNEEQRVALYDPRTRKVTVLTNYTSASLRNLITSPDGNRIAYLRTADDGWTYRVMLVDAATGRRREVTAFMANWVTLQWAPDGNRIFYRVSGHGDSSTDIGSIKPDGKDDRTVVEEAALGGIFER